MSASSPSPPRGWGTRLPQRWRGPAAGIAAIALSALVGAGIMHLVDRHRMRIAVLPLAPISIAAATRTDGEPVAIKGQVAEIFGGRFVLDDGSGRALVDSGPAGESEPSVTADETVTVEGRFERNALHAAIITHGDGRIDAFGPPPPGPPRGPRWLRAVF